MKVVVAVVVYDRFQNVQEWTRCFEQCDTHNAELVIIHNYKNEAEEHAYRSFCQRANVRYIARKNVGFDIGAFQDVCKDRLEEFPQDYEYLLWCTDDIFPMKKTFVQDFLAKFRDGVACVAYEISREVKLHVRTTGFMVRKKYLPYMQFVADPIVNKDQCYEFEHRNRGKSLIDIVSKMGKVIQVSDVEISPLWDTGHRSNAANARYKRREKEHIAEFPKNIIPAGDNPKVVIICPIYNTYPEIIASMVNQTYKNWELRLIHDGPSHMYNIKGIVEATNDERIIYKELPERTGNFGHKIRRDELSSLTDGDYLVISNGDNHHCPVYLEWMLKGFTHPSVVATYCSDMTHSYKAWENIECSMKQGYVDMAGVMLRRGIAQQVGFKDVESHSADWVFFKSIIDIFGENSFKKITGCLLVHN